MDTYLEGRSISRNTGNMTTPIILGCEKTCEQGFQNIRTRSFPSLGSKLPMRYRHGLIVIPYPIGKVFRCIWEMLIYISIIANITRSTEMNRRRDQRLDDVIFFLVCSQQFTL